MRGKKPRSKSKANASPADVARAAGCSKQLAARLLARGMSKQVIIERISENKARKTERLDLPATPVRVNGHAAGIPTFSEAQRRKEFALARIREAEADQKTGELMPVEQALQWLRHIYTPLVQSFRALPDELRDLLTPELAELLRRRVEGIIGAADTYWVSCRSRAGQPLSDGALDAGGGYRVRWEIIPPPPEAE
jgi:predicted transcriptional regulator